MQKYDSNCTSRTNWVDLAGIHCTLSEPEPLNAFESIEGPLNIEVDDIVLRTYFWEQSDVPSLWNLYWTEAAASGGGLEIDNLVFGDSLMRYCGAHSWFNCDVDTPCWCEGHDCRGTHETEGHALAAAATAKGSRNSLDCRRTTDTYPLRALQVQLALVDVLDPLQCPDHRNPERPWCQYETKGPSTGFSRHISEKP
jgi:hypothetical protein